MFMRSFGGAMLDSPGPLDRGEKAFFSITPVNESWPPERQESYLREDNARMLRLLTIHEAVPGHYLQGVYANRVSSQIRTIFGSGLFAEGWAVYVTQVMIDLGYGADDPALLLTHWKFYLRSITNAILDARIHVHDMNEDEALELMVEGGFQEEGEARAKYDRARLSSTQLSTYFTGSMEFWDIEREVRRRAAVAAGASVDAVPEPRVVGWLRRDPRLRLPPASRIPHQPRRATDVPAAADHPRLRGGRRPERSRSGRVIDPRHSSVTVPPDHVPGLRPCWTVQH